jgi:hypothetical protein
MRVAFWGHQAWFWGIAGLITVLILIGTGWISAKAEETPAISWTSTLKNVRGCVAESKPDMRRAVDCYKETIAACVSRPSDDYQACLEDAVTELMVLFETYNLRNLDPELAAQNSPERCQDFVEENTPSELPEDEFLLQCEFTALSRQVVAAHIESVWGEQTRNDEN